MLIDAVMTVNTACTTTKQECLAKHKSHDQPLGTVALHMRLQPMEFGVQVGMYGVAIYNIVLGKVPGVPFEDVTSDRLRRVKDPFTSLVACLCSPV